MLQAPPRLRGWGGMWESSQTARPFLAEGARAVGAVERQPPPPARGRGTCVIVSFRPWGCRLEKGFLILFLFLFFTSGANSLYGE